MTLRKLLGLTLAAILGTYCNLLAAHGSGAETSQAKTGEATYTAKSSGTRLLVAGPASIRMLAEASNLGRDDIEVGELLLPVEVGEVPAHAHGSLEIFYVVEGVLGHKVNGVEYKLNPGDIGFVKPGDSVTHAALTDETVKAVVIWVPGGEADRLVEHAGFTSTPIE